MKKKLEKKMQRMCFGYPDCKGCPLERQDCSKLFYAHRVVSDAFEKWAAEHPEDEHFEQLADGIYFDPKHRIVADELTEIYTFEVTYIDENGGLRGITSEKVLKNLLDADDVKLIRRQQFVTKAHEEEL